MAQTSSVHVLIVATAELTPVCSGFLAVGLQVHVHVLYFTVAAIGDGNELEYSSLGCLRKTAQPGPGRNAVAQYSRAGQDGLDPALSTAEDNKSGAKVLRALLAAAAQLRAARLVARRFSFGRRPTAREAPRRSSPRRGLQLPQVSPRLSGSCTFHGD